MKATDTFHHPDYGHNCAQAVAYRWREKYTDTDIVEQMAACGGGRAPEGICGALHAAMLACPSHAAAIKEQFAQQCGATTCRLLKTVCKTPCPQCVATADALVEKYESD